MKKLLSMVVVVFMMVSFTACGSSDKTTDEGSGEKETKIALLIESVGDLSFNDSAKRGTDKAVEDFGVDVKVIEYGDTNKVESSFVDVAEAGYDLVIVNSAFTDVLQEKASEYPDTKFILFDSEVDYDSGDLSNVYSIVYNANESSFLVGYIGASMSETGQLAFLGGMESPIINDFLLGYIQGAQLANENIKVTSGFTGSWTDSAKGKELTYSMISGGADIGFAAAGGSGIGQIEAAVEKGIKVFGVDMDQATIFKEQGNEEYASVIVTSSMKNVDNSLYRAIDLYLKGELKFGVTEKLGIAEGGVGIADNEYYQKLVSEEIRNEVKELEEKVKSGEIKVDTAYGKTADEIADIKNAVKP